MKDLSSNTKKKIILASLIVAIIILTVVVGIFSTVKNSKESSQIANPELARAMNYGELTSKDEETQSENVRFSVYFARDLNGDGYAEKVKGTCKEIGGEDTLYMNINVLGDGTLQNAKIEIQSDNMYFKTALVDDEVINGNYISENTTSINLKDMVAGTQKLIFGQVRSGDYRYASTNKDALGKDINKLSGINKIKLTGTHVANDGTETKIEKEIELPVDWYSTTKAEIPYTYGSNNEKNKYQNYNTESIVDEENNEVNLEFKIVSQESNNKLLLAKSTIEGTIPELNGYKATKVEIIGEDVHYSYDNETGNFTAYREAKTTESGIVEKESYTSSWNNARYSEFKLKVTYPLEAYEAANGTVVLNIPVKATFEGYNNDNEEFNNPYVSNVAEDIITVTYERGGGDVISYDIQVGTWVGSPYNVYAISKENAVDYYNEVEEKTKDTYEVRWYVSRGNSGTISNVQLKEQDSNYTDKFLTTENQYEDMLKYSKNIGIYFTTPGAMFGENGWIKVYNDETDELIHEFTSEDWEGYNKSNPYYYDEPVDHIRIETSEADKVSSFTAISIKEIDNEKLTTDYTREEFNKLSKIYSYLSGYAKYSDDEDYQKLKDDVGIANYDEPISMAQITNVTPTTLSTQETTNMKITIGTVNLVYNVREWTNGTFLLKFPEEVLLAEINDVTINNANVNILGYDIYEKDGNYYLKILTENTSPETFTITVDADITPDPRKLSATKNIELYAYNEECNNYKDSLRKEDIYDINGDGSTKDIVDYSTRSIQFVGPASLLTTETGSDYNDEGDEIKTTIAPQVALIDKTQKNKTAKISVQITNNYSGNISGVVVVGKTPFEGNTSQILGKDLGSTYTAEMTGPIELPEKLQGIATVYYSENEIVNNNLNDSRNNWKTEDEVIDFSKIRTYAIDLGDYKIQKGEEYICTYEIQVPQNVSYNDVTYSSHAIYFYLETDEGKLQERTETNKLGFMVARNYNISINKVKENTSVPVQGATFNVTEDGQDESKIGITNEEGTFTIENLYVDKIYTLKEIRTPGSYEKNEMEVRFKAVVEENGDLNLQIISGEGNIKDYNITQATKDTNGTISFKIENTPKYRLIVTKKDSADSSNVEGIKFKLEGEGLGSGIIVTSGKDGKLNLTGLSQNVEYTLTETEAKGYYINETPVKFKVVNNSGNLQFVVTSGSFASTSQVTTGTGISGLEAQDKVEASLTNEKIPTYEITVKKFAKDEDTILKNAQYKITGEGLDEDGEIFTTDENGEFTIQNLYEYVEGKNITGEYTLEEITPPEGYALDSRKLQFKVQRNEEGELELSVIGENFLRNSSVEENTVNLELEDEPLFKISKIDGTSKLPVADAKFVIIQINEEYEELGYAQDINGNVIGVPTQIEGEEEEVPIVTTDENGVISYGLKSGLYKAIEIEAPEGYELPENEEDRTYYFGIGESKAQETTFGTAFNISISGDLWNKFDSVEKTADNGLITGGSFTKEADLNKDGRSDVKGTDSYYFSGFIAKYSNSGEFEFANSVFTTDGETEINKVIPTTDGGYVAVGNYKGKDLQVGEVSTGLTNDTNYTNAIIVKFGSSGDYQWSKEVKLEDTDYNATAVTENISGNIVVGVTTGSNPIVLEYSSSDGSTVAQTTLSGNLEISDMDGSNSQNVIIVSETLTDTTTGRVDFYSNGSISGGKALDFNANAVAKIENGNAIIVGNYTGTSQSITSKGNYDAIIVEYDVNSNTIVKSKFIRGTLDEIATSVAPTADGGYFVGGYTYSSQVDFDQDESTYEIPSISGNSDGYVIKYDSEGNQEWYKQVGGDNLDEVNALVERDDNEFVAVGYFNSTMVKGDKADTTGVSIDQYTDGFGFNYGEVVTAPEVPESSEIIVENNLKKFKITTDVLEIDGVKGGTIKGEDETPYEEVEYQKDSKKDIIATPEPGYKVLKITVNDEEIEFTPEEDGSVILDKFINMTSDKHVVVQFSNSVSTVIVHHYKDGTTEKLAEDETLTGEIGTNYTTAPKDIEDYEVVIEKLPSNASGQYKEAVQEVIYYYKQSPVKLIVHHYLEGTEEIVPGSEDDQINEERDRNSEYTTSPATDIDAKYELVEMPSNASGTLTENETVVTYYYRVKDSAGVIVHHIDTETKEQIAPDVIIPANGTGKYGDSYTTEVSEEIPENYEYVTRTDNWEGTMIDKLTEVTYEYKLVDPTVENVIGKTATTEITSKDDEITYNIAYSATVENYIGKAQITIVDTLPYKIDEAKSTLNGGTYDARTNTITWKEVVNGIDTYANPESGNILINKTIKVVYTNLDTTQETIVNNVSGQVKLLTPEKTSEETTYSAETIQNYKVQVTVNKAWVDNETQAQRRPEKIKFTLTANGKDTENTYELITASETSHTFYDLDKYDSKGNTIEYGIKETVIDGEEHKDDLKFYETSETKNELDESTGNREIEVTNTFKKPNDTTKITVTKEWKDENNKNKKRPEEVTIQVLGNGTTQDVILSEANKLADNVWQIQITKPVYDDNGEEIEYTADEKDVPDYYEKTAEGLKVTNTSTYAKVITHYYIQNPDGTLTTNKVPTKDGDVNEDTVQEGNLGDSYITTPTEDIPDYYELVQEKLPDNSTGTMNQEVTEVTYYYKLKEYEYTVNYFYDGVKDESKTDHLTATYGEQIKEYTDKVKPGYAFEKDEYVPLTITSDPSKNVINVYYEKVDFSYTVEYYYDNVKDENATESYTATYQDVIEDYEDKLKDGYRFDKTENLPLTVTEVPENNVIKVYYVRKDTKVIVKYLEKGTNKVLDESANYEIPGKVFDHYETEQKEFTGYNFVEATDNTEGNMTEDVITVIYYYELKTPNAEQNISKTATESIESLGDPITYNITYTANVIDYMGEAEVTIVDTLPFKLDTEKTNIAEDLDGGTYNEKDNTITWVETVSDINSYESRNNNIEITKTITVVYKDLVQGTTKIENKVSGNIKTKTPEKDFGTVEAKAETGTKFTLNIPVSKIWDDDTNKLGNRPTSVIFKLTGSDGNVYTKELSVPGTAGSTTTQDSENPNKWNDIFENLPKYDSNRNEIVYTLTEEETEEGDLQFYEATIDNENKTITNKDTYGKVTVHYYIIDNEGKKTTNRVPDEEGKEVPDIIIEGQEGDKYETEPAEDVSEKYELVQTELPENADGTIEKYNPEKEQVVIYYYRLKPAKVIINYLEKDGDNDDRNNQILSPHEEIDGYVDDKYDTDEKHKKETITKDGKKYTLVEDSGNTEGKMTVDDINVTYYYLQNTKATVRYVARDPETHEIIKDLEKPYTEEGLVGDEFVTNEKAFIGYKLVEAPENKTIKMTKEEQTLIYYYEPVYTGLVENHIDITNDKLLYTETHEVQVGDDYNIPSKEFAGYDLVEEKLPDNAEGTMGEDLVTVNYYYIKKVVLEVNYIDILTGEPLSDQIVDNTKHEGDKYETEEKEFNNYDLVKVEGNKKGTLEVEVDEDGNIINNKTVVTYYYAKKAQVEEHHIDIRTGEELEEPTVHNGHVGDKYDIPSKEFLSYEVVEETEDGKNMLPENSKGTMTEEKQIVTYYYYQPAKVIVHYVDKTTEEELEETDPESGEVVSSRVTIDGQIEDEYKTEAKEFPYYTLVEEELPENAEGKMKVEITKDENGKDIVNNIIDVYYYYEPKPFNIGVEKTISKVTVNGKEQNIDNNKLTKVEIYRKDVNDTKVEVEYTIKVTNNEEVDGKAIIRENIPDGMSVVNNDGTWDEKDGYLEKVIPEIKAGETKEYKITLAWDGGDANLGEKDNKVEITQTDNVPGFKENNEQDNSSEATVMINVSTGSVPWPLVIALVAVAGLETVTLSYAKVLTNRQKKARKTSKHSK